MLLYTASLVAMMACVSTAMMIEGEQMSIDDAIIKAGSKDSMTKMFEIMQDEDTVMVELDMLYKMETYNTMMEEMAAEKANDTAQGSRKKRKAISSDRYRWTNGRVPYEISYDFSSRDRNIINAAINDYHKYTCIRFAPATSSDRNRVRFQNGGGCSSYVGMIGGQQPISLASGCRYKGIVIHEMGHAIGFQHEQTRPDRNGYVTINTQNIQSGLEYNFQQYSSSQVNNYNVPYDYTSVMHYSQNAFSRNGRPTITARDSRYQSAMGNREGFSFNDIKLANAIYSCSSGCRNPPRCPTGAFVGQDCRCKCDSGDRSDPVKDCDGTTVTERPVTTTPTPTRGPMSCQDKNSYCPRWADAGYCTGTYVTYMTQNCQYSCRLCATLTTTTPMPTPPVENCADENRYCAYWASVGECSRNPSYMSRYCKRSCDVCTETTSDCRDMNANCPSWTQYCNNNIYKSYLEMNCARSCQVCTANDENPKPESTTTAPMKVSCMDRKAASWCQSRSRRCQSSPRIMYACEKTCNKC